jgi:hypothetical protein
MAIATTASFPQYAGELYLFKNYSNPFLASLGSGGKITDNFDFALSSSATLASGVQPSISETDSVTAPTSFDNFTRDQDVNTCQIIQKYVRTSNKMLSSWNKQIGNSSDYGSIGGENMLADVHEWNTNTTLKQIYRDMNYSCWNGSYQRAANAATAAQTRGLDEAITTNETTISGVITDITKAQMDAHLVSVFDTGVDMSETVIWVGASAKVALSNLYSLNLQTQPRDRQVGGVNVQMLVTDFGEFPIAVDFDVPSNKIFFVNMGIVSNVWCPVFGKGNLFYEEKADAAAARTGMLYGQWGLDYGAEEYHSVIKATG